MSATEMLQKTSLRQLKWLLLILLSGLAVAVSWAQQNSKAVSSAKADAISNETSDSHPAKANNVDSSLVIGAEDVLAISVWKEPDISRTIPVRSDGKISLALAGELQASGKTPGQLEKEIASKLRTYISDPEVTVIVQEIKSHKFNVLGQVVHPGSYPLNSSATVLDAIALAGGFRDFAKTKSIYVLRQNDDGSQLRIPFNYNEVIKGNNSEQNVKLRVRDTVVVP
jgi:polysaccharide biosynthesis/export protein